MTIGAAPLCLLCEWYKIPGTGENLTCKAFPEKIPNSIIMGRSHIEPIKGDNGLQYKELEGKEYRKRIKDLKRYTRG